MDVFQHVKNQLTMHDVLQHYGIQINGAGFALCPFHSDHRASLKVYNDSFYCFACGTGGDLIKFVALLNDVRNIDACKELAAAFNIPIDTSSSSSVPQTSFRAKYMREKRERERREASKFEQKAKHANDVLSAMMRYLNDGKYNCKYPDKKHIRAMQLFAECEYFCNWFDENPREFLATNWEVVERYETIINRWHNENETV